MHKKYFFIILLFCVLPLRSREEVVYLAQGNFALPTSQQPAPLFCFGQTIIDKGDILLYGYIDWLKGTGSSFIEIVPQFYYGITDNLSLGIGTPLAAKFKFNNCSSSGIEDLIIQLEYAFYNNDHLTQGTQLTFVGDVTFPTGSSKKTPATGLGSLSFFLGLTASYMSTKWYLFASPGYIITAPHNNIHLGNQWIYQWGLGRNLYSVPSKRILTLLLEFFGTHGGLDTLPLKASQRLGGNNLFIGPSLWFATERLVLNAGIAFPVMQNISATNSKHSFLFACEMGWTFK